MGKRALLSVHDKRGLAELGAGLAGLGFELVASGGTARALVQAGLAVTPVEVVTGSPEILGGRVKTLHPAIHGGILARRTNEHLADLQAHGIGTIDLVVCNLYPFAATVARAGVTEAEAIEEIDIGGVTLLRAAAKNFESVTVVVNPDDYGRLVEVLAAGGPTLEQRRIHALEAFRHTAAYDAAIATWLGGHVEPQGELPGSLAMVAHRTMALRYGENPHQQGALYTWAGGHQAFAFHQGKELSFNNIVDLEAAWAMATDFQPPTVAIIKHTNPSGLACATTPLDAYRAALACDPVSAFGSIIAVNRTVDLSFVEEVGALFVEVIVAPSFTEDALAWLARKKKNCRVMTPEAAAAAPALEVRSVRGGLLVQSRDDRGADAAAWRVVTKRAPTDAEREALAFVWVVTKHVKSNAIVMAQGTTTVGVGAGQMNRVDSVGLAAKRAGERARGSVLGSDAFFPFPDGVEAAAAAGVTAIAQPGGSIRDQEVIDAADRLGLAMVFTGERHFKH